MSAITAPGSRTDVKTLEEMWQMYRQNLHGYDPEAEAELEAAFKSGAWCFLQALKSVPTPGAWAKAIEQDFEKFKATRRE
jgi:hypothetical protein